MTNITARLEDLYKQATVERSHYYVGVTVKEAIQRIEELEAENDELRSQLGIEGRVSYP